MLLHDERRRSDVGKQHSLCESHLKHIAHVTPVAQHDSKTAERITPFSAERFSHGNDSLKRKQQANNTSPSPNRIQKMPCHPITSVSRPPTIGAATGATPLMAPITASILASSRPEYLSVATERDMTIPPAPAMPCNRRNATNCSMLCENRHNSVDAINSHMATSKGNRRPYRSLSGPKNICPTARPIILVVNPN